MDIVSTPTLLLKYLWSQAEEARNLSPTVENNTLLNGCAATFIVIRRKRKRFG